MDAPALSPEQLRELERLRRRAYGPGADIAEDPLALERLTALETASRTSIEPEPIPTLAVWRRAGGAPAPLAEAVLPDTDEPVSEAGVSEGDGDAPAAASTPTRAARGRRVSGSRWFFAALALLVVATIVWGVGRITEPRSDATLAPVDVVADLPDEFTQQYFTGYYEIVPDSLRQYESFRGLRVLSVATTGGARCLLVFTEAFRFQTRNSCTPSDLDPTVDYPIWPGLPPEIIQDLPQGSVMRFVLHDGRVQVRVSVADGTVRS